MAYSIVEHAKSTKVVLILTWFPNEGRAIAEPVPENHLSKPLSSVADRTVRE